MRMVVRFFTLVITLLLPAAASSQELQARLGSLSPQRAFTESADGKAGIARLAALEQKQAREIAEKNKALQLQERALQEAGPSMSDAVRRQRTRELEKFRVDVQRFIDEAQADFLGTQRDIESAFVGKLRPAVERVAKAKGLQLVVNLDANMVVWADPAVDITSDVVKQLTVPDPPRRP